jgi:hypothetical protein
VRLSLGEDIGNRGDGYNTNVLVPRGIKMDCFFAVLTCANASRLSPQTTSVSSLRKQGPITTDARCRDDCGQFGANTDIVVMGPGSRSLRSLVRDDKNYRISRFNFQTANPQAILRLSLRATGRNDRGYDPAISPRMSTRVLLYVVPL